jgi:hypothetical protein
LVLAGIALGGVIGKAIGTVYGAITGFFGRSAGEVAGVATGETVQAAGRFAGEFRRVFQTSAGPIDVSCNITAEGRTAVVKELLVYPEGADAKLAVGNGDMKAGFKALMQELKSMSFDFIRIEDTVRMNGATPGRPVNMTLRLRWRDVETPTQVEIVADAMRFKSVGASVEQVILFLRDKGLNKISSIKAVCTLYGKSTNDAKVLVDNSEAWSDRFYSDMEFRDKAMRALLELSSGGDKDIPPINFQGSSIDE